MECICVCVLVYVYVRVVYVCGVYTCACRHALPYPLLGVRRPEEDIRCAALNLTEPAAKLTAASRDLLSLPT